MSKSAAPNRWTAYLDAAMDGASQQASYAHALGLPPLSGWEAGKVYLTYKVAPEMLNPAGSLFGGYLAALADHAVALTIMTVLGPDEMFTTSDLRVSFFRPVLEGSLTITGRVVHRGRNMAHVEADFVRADAKPAARATATQVIFTR
ncbi:MAG: PaaI family thioesterase [Thermodesulfobacteriota bacterium]